MRDLLIENEVHIKRLMQEIKVLKHRVRTLLSICTLVCFRLYVRGRFAVDRA